MPEPTPFRASSETVETASDRLQRTELLRVQILLEAYNKHFQEFPSSYLRAKFHIFRGQPTSDIEVDGELQYLVSKRLLSVRYSPLGATKLFRITADGVDLAEREYSNLLELS